MISSYLWAEALRLAHRDLKDAQQRIIELETALRRIRDEQAAFGTHTGVTHTSKHGHAAVQIARAALDKDK